MLRISEYLQQQSQMTWNRQGAGRRAGKRRVQRPRDRSYPTAPANDAVTRGESLLPTSGRCLRRRTRWSSLPENCPHGSRAAVHFVIFPSSCAAISVSSEPGYVQEIHCERDKPITSVAHEDRRRNGGLHQLPRRCLGKTACFDSETRNCCDISSPLRRLRCCFFSAE